MAEEDQAPAPRMIDVAKATLDELLAEFIRLGNALSVTAKERIVILAEL